MNINPESEYTSRLGQRRSVHDELLRKERAVAYSRAFVFAAGVVVLWMAAVNHMFASTWVFLPAVVFLALVFWHDRLIHRRQLAARSVKYYERGLLRLRNGWPKEETPFQPVIDAKHPYGADLDLFGSESMFERMTATRTETGRNTLAGWLLTPAAPEEIRLRQASAADLRPRLDFREDLAVLGSDVSIGARSPLRRWASHKAEPVSMLPRAAALLLASLAVYLLYATFAWKWNANWFALVVFCEYIFSRAYRPLVQSISTDLDRAGEELALLQPLLQRLERETFSSPQVESLRSILHVDGTGASEQIARLRKLIELLDSMRNPYFAPLGALILWRTQVAFAIEAWRARCGPEVERWLDAMGQFEALASFAQYSFENPNDPFPEIAESGPCFDGEGLGHPLLSETACVRNDLRLDSQIRMLVVSGSNMSGKSTLLRTVGINTVLALAGAPVRATRLRVSPLMVGASLHIFDSLQSGSSHFYAEITRLRLLMDTAGGPIPLLFLLDEILHGTNSSDRQKGAEAVVRGYIERGAIGLITTHDLALARIAEELAPHAANVHFEDHMEDGRIAFDYRIHPGIITKSNAIALMRAVGLEV